jgi:RNA polymerase sigma-70 factor, ECF subfamily
MANLGFNTIEIIQLQEPERLSSIDVTLENLTDAQLIEHYISGDESAFRELVGRYKDSLFTFLHRYLNKQEVVEDIFQETFLQFIISRDNYDMNRPLRPWLFTIAVNKARDVIRKLKITREIPIGMIEHSEEMSFNDVLDVITSDNSTPTSELEKSENAIRVQEIISIMPVKLREILLLAYFNGFTYRQISEMLNIPIGTVKSRLNTAIRNFANIWKSLFNEQDY